MENVNKARSQKNVIKCAGLNGEVTVTFLPGLTWNVTSDAETGALLFYVHVI